MPERTAATLPGWAWWFAPFALVSAFHVVVLALGVPALAGPSKLLLMPALALAAVAAGRGIRPAVVVLVLGALALSWLGDGAATFAPFLPELPVMLGSFGAAHLLYIALFVGALRTRRPPWWTLVYAAWWVLLLVILWPYLGGLAVAVAAYGVVLAGTAVSAATVRPLVAVGGAFFLASDTVLAFRLFRADAVPASADALVMLTYALGQGLIIAGVIAASRKLEVGS